MNKEYIEKKKSNKEETYIRTQDGVPMMGKHGQKNLGYCQKYKKPKEQTSN